MTRLADLLFCLALLALAAHPALADNLAPTRDTPQATAAGVTFTAPRDWSVAPRGMR